MSTKENTLNTDQRLDQHQLVEYLNREVVHEVRHRMSTGCTVNLSFEA